MYTVWDVVTYLYAIVSGDVHHRYQMHRAARPLLVYIFMYIYICIYINIYICIYVYNYIYSHTWPLSSPAMSTTGIKCTTPPARSSRTKPSGTEAE